MALVADPLLADMRVATGDDIATTASSYVLLDTDRPTRVQLTTYSKNLHRKRPHLLPLYDRNVRRCYCQDFDDAPATVPKGDGRSYVEFADQLMHAMRDDLQREGWKQTRGDVASTLSRHRRLARRKGAVSGVAPASRLPGRQKELR